MPPQKCDYIECSMDDQDISECNVAKRIVHLLQFYDAQQSSNQSATIIPIYEYMQSLDANYNISNFLEDWHQLKVHRLSKYENIEWMQTAVNSKLDRSGQSEYLRRHQRDREKEEFEGKVGEIDYKNLILMDQMDSMFFFLFHSMEPRRRFVIFKDIDDVNVDDESEEKLEIPQSITGCNVEQLTYILNHHIFDQLKENAKAKLKDYLQDISKYIKDNQVDGNALTNMKRKEFINEIAEHLKNTKLKGALAFLYKDLMSYGNESNLEEKTELVACKSKFITETESKEQLYSFGTKFLYNPMLKISKLFVHAKYPSIKEELLQHLMRQNKKDDAVKLLREQLRIIIRWDSMDEEVRVLLIGMVRGQSISNSDVTDVLWINDNENESNVQLKQIISKLCKCGDVDEEIEEWNSSNIGMGSLRTEFVAHAIEQIKVALKVNKEKFIEEQQEKRINLFIGKCEMKMKMESIKKMRATKNLSRAQL